jgi:hypothetical protein
VLDEIHEQLAAVTSWTPLVNRLVDETNCPITFMKLELEKLDNPNELYIKMNSRGKQLTAFENFKSEMLEKIKVYNFMGKMIIDELSLVHRSALKTLKQIMQNKKEPTEMEKLLIELCDANGDFTDRAAIKDLVEYAKN